MERQAPRTVADSVMSPTTFESRNFSHWLNDQLRARKLTQRQLAYKSGVDHSTISRLTRGIRTPSLRTADRLARSLGMGAGLDDAHRQGPRRTESPLARVEHALRLDDLLSEAQVRQVMLAYLAIRAAQPRAKAR
jgi:transcriptional regulator with XRE-family HTH domain